MNKPWIILAVTALIGLTGCEERYRYPCQDPEHWNEKQCQKPFCSANGTCPEDLTHYEKKESGARPTLQNKGECK